MDTTTVKGKAEATAKDPVEARMTASLTQIRTYNKDLTKPETPDPLFSFYMELQKAFPKITRRDITDMLSSNIIFTQETPTEKRTEKFEKLPYVDRDFQGVTDVTAKKFTSLLYT